MHSSVDPQACSPAQTKRKRVGVHMFAQVDLAEVRKLSQQQRSVASGLKDGAIAATSIATGDVPQVRCLAA